MGFMRSFIAFTLLVGAVVLGFAGMGAHWLDRMARTPAPMQKVMAPLAADPRVTAELGSTLRAEALESVPAELREQPVGEEVSRQVDRAVDETIADPGLLRAWNDSVNRSRIAYVSALDQTRVDQSHETPTIWFDLSPVVELGRANLRDGAPQELQPHLAGVGQGEARVPLGQPSASMTSSLADGVHAARHWPWLHLSAVALGVIALFTGSRRGRWVALALAGVVAAVGLWFGRSLAATVTFPDGESLAGVIRTQIVEGGKEHFLDFTHPATYVAYGAIALGVVGLVLASLTRRR